MPFIAKDKKTGERIDITAISQPRRVLSAGSCICPLCGIDFIVKAGLITVPHFAHKQVCSSDWYVHPESAQHRAGKLFLIENLPREFEEYMTARFELEVPIPEIKRIADVMATLETGWRIAHEVQLASITIQELQERTDDYNRAGVDVFWWLGNRAATATNESWCYEVYGFCLGLEFHTGPVGQILAQAS